MTVIAAALFEQHYDVHHRGSETHAPTSSSSSSNRWRRHETVRAQLAEAEPIKKSIDTAVYREEGMFDEYDGEQDEPEGDEVRETGLAVFPSISGEDPEADDALAESLHLDAVAMVAWQRQGQRQEQRQRKRQGQKQEQRQQSVCRGAQEASCRVQEPYDLSRVRCARTLGWRRLLSQERQERRFAAAIGTRYLGLGGETPSFDLTLLDDDTSADATALVTHTRFDASDILVETPPKAAPGVKRPRKPPCVVSFLHRLHRHLGALEGTAVEARTPPLNVLLVDCGFATTQCTGATEDPAARPYTETDTRGSSKTLVRHICKVCVKVDPELLRNQAAVRTRTIKAILRVDRPQFRDVSRAMHVRPQVTLNAREVEVVFGLLTRNAHANLSRFPEFVGLLDDAIESILEPTENMNMWNMGTTTMTNDTFFCISQWSEITSKSVKSLYCVLFE